VRTTWDEDEASRWSIKSIDVGESYVAAVAVAARKWLLEYRDVDRTLLEF